MKVKNENLPKTESRRRFLNFSFLFGLGVFASGKVQAKTSKLEEEKKVRLIMANGQVVEVDKSRIPNFAQVKPVSEAEFHKWKESGK